MSEFLVGAVEAARATLGLTEVFVGVIVNAVIGFASALCHCWTRLICHVDLMP